MLVKMQLQTFWKNLSHLLQKKSGWQWCWIDLSYQTPNTTGLVTGGHLETYRSWMELNLATNTFKCKVFVITLTGVARWWFRTLRPGTTSSFRQLSESFISQFTVHKVHRKPARHLYTITQLENESTKSYFTHFIKEKMNVQDRSDAATSRALMVGLRNSTILKYLVSVGKPNAVSYPELIAEIRRHIDAEKASNLKASKLSQYILLRWGKRKQDSKVEAFK